MTRRERRRNRRGFRRYPGPRCPAPRPTASRRAGSPVLFGAFLEGVVTVPLLLGVLVDALSGVGRGDLLPFRDTFELDLGLMSCEVAHVRVVPPRAAINPAGRPPPATI